MQQLLSTALAALVAWLGVAPAPHRTPPPPSRPPQFIVVSFDGSGGGRMWDYWLGVGRHAGAHFTFFVSGAYLLDWAHRMEYHPPREPDGSSAIGFAQAGGDLTVARTLRGIRDGYLAGDEIGTHFVGHFCGPGGVGEWTAADWRSELTQFFGLLFRRNVPFVRSEIVGDRTPCLEGDLSALYSVLASLGFRYDASRLAPLGQWPRRIDGLWSFPLLELPFPGHTYSVVSMDYNFFANQVSLSPVQAEAETYRTLWSAFRTSYLGGRAPLSFGQHFETWNGWAYDHALARFLLAACRLPEVRCVSFNELADFLDSLTPAQLARYRAGHFPRASARAVLNHG